MGMDDMTFAHCIPGAKVPPSLAVLIAPCSKAIMICSYLTSSMSILDGVDLGTLSTVPALSVNRYT